MDWWTFEIKAHQVLSELPNTDPALTRNPHTTERFFNIAFLCHSYKLQYCPLASRISLYNVNMPTQFFQHRLLSNTQFCCFALGINEERPSQFVTYVLVTFCLNSAVRKNDQQRTSWLERHLKSFCTKRGHLCTLRQRCIFSRHSPKQNVFSRGSHDIQKKRKQFAVCIAFRAVTTRGKGPQFPRRWITMVAPNEYFPPHSTFASGKDFRFEYARAPNLLLPRAPSNLVTPSCVTMFWRPQNRAPRTLCSLYFIEATGSLDKAVNMCRGGARNWEAQLKIDSAGVPHSTKAKVIYVSLLCSMFVFNEKIKCLIY